jgi:hypothetical protein
MGRSMLDGSDESPPNARKSPHARNPSKGAQTIAMTPRIGPTGVEVSTVETA